VSLDIGTSLVHFKFTSTYKNIVFVHLKWSSFWPSADAKPMSMIKCLPCTGSACLFSLYVYTMI